MFIHILYSYIQTFSTIWSADLWAIVCCSRALPTALLIVLHDCTANNVHAPISRMEKHMHILHIDALPHRHPSKNVTLKPPCSVSPRLPDQCSSVAWTEHTQISLDNDPLSTPQDVPCHPLWTTGSRHRPASPWQPPALLSSLTRTQRPVLISVPAGCCI